MVELSLEEAMELKSNRKLPPWRPRLMLRARREKSRRSQDQRSSRPGDQQAGASPEPCGTVWPHSADQELFCSLHAGTRVWDFAIAAVPQLSSSTSCLGKGSAVWRRDL